LVVQVVSIIGVVLYARWEFPNHELFARLWKVDGEVLKAVFLLGFPIGLTALSEVTLFAMSTTMMGWLGTVPLVAHGIAINIAGLTFMLHLGLSSAATVRAGNALGRGDYEHLAAGARMAIWMSMGFALVAVLVMVSIPRPLIALFISASDPNYEAVLTLGATLMLLAALFQFVDGAQAMALGLLRGVQDTKWPMILAAISYWLIGVSTGYGLAFVAGWEGVGVWLGLVAGLATASVLLMWRFWRQIMVDLRAGRRAS
jgi:MATE family multidrug resistance protein